MRCASKRWSASLIFTLCFLFTLSATVIVIERAANTAHGETDICVTSPENLSPCVPTPTPTPTPTPATPPVIVYDCEGTPNGNAVDLGCGCAKPAPLSNGCCPGDLSCNRCIYVASWANYSTLENQEYSLQAIEDQFTFSHRKKNPECFKNDLGLNKICETHYSNATTTVERWGKCDGNSANVAEFLGVPEELRGPRKEWSFYKPTCQWWNLLCHLYNALLSATAEGSGLYWWFMNDKCEYIADPPEGTEICGISGVSWSPISLIWNDSEDWQSNMTVVSFSLSPNEKGAYALWKASSKAPLLVYDPEGKGAVTSAKQLFGNFAFGGKTVNVTDYKSENLRSAWENGYEAMALLDNNHDGKLTGAELKALRLWFDNNQNAQVDLGELRSLDDAQVSALYYRNPIREMGSSDLSLKIGYERIVNGKLTTGKSIDWFAQTFSTKQDALQALQALSTKNQSVNQYAQSENLAEAFKAKNWPKNPAAFTPHLDGQHNNDLSGYWFWELAEEKGSEHPGIFAFEQLKNNKFVGYSITESALAKNRQGYHSGVIPVPAAGTIERAEDGKSKLDFEVMSPQSSAVARSTAILSADGTSMRGKTIQTLPAGEPGHPHRNISVSYEWVARKFVNWRKRS